MLMDSAGRPVVLTAFHTLFSRKEEGAARGSTLVSASRSAEPDTGCLRDDKK
jgi:hypothetical protein